MAYYVHILLLNALKNECFIVPLFSISLAFSGFSTNTKYDPYQIKAEIASRRDRVSNLFFYSITKLKEQGIWIYNDMCAYKLNFFSVM